MTTRNVHHTCNGIDHPTPLDLTRQRKRLGCGCHRLTGVHCDGTGIKVLTGVCAMHRDDAAPASEGERAGGAG